MNSRQAIENFARATNIGSCSFILGQAFYLIAHASPFFLICAGDNAGVGYHLCIMPRPD